MQVFIHAEVAPMGVMPGDIVYYAGERQGPAIKEPYPFPGHAEVICIMVQHDVTGEPHALAFFSDEDVAVEASVDLKESDLSKSPRDVLMSRNSEAALAELRRKLSGE